MVTSRALGGVAVWLSLPRLGGCVVLLYVSAADGRMVSSDSARPCVAGDFISGIIVMLHA